jgi:hypothetical protein
MKRIVAAAVLGVVALAPSAGGASWSLRKPLPKAIDSPIVRPKVQEGHKPGKHWRVPKAKGPYSF